MRDDARLQTVIEILDHVCQAQQKAGRGADFIIQQQLRQRRFMGGGDRRAVKARLYSILRHWGALTWRLHQVSTSPEFSEVSASGVAVTARCLVAVQVLLMDSDDLDPLFSGQTYAPQPLGAAEQALVEAAARLDNVPSWATHNMPEWVWTRLEVAYGAQTPTLATALNQPAPLDVRVLGAQDRSHFLQLCAAQGLAVSALPHSLSGVRFTENTPIGHVPGSGTRDILIQDEGSQIVASLAAGVVCHHDTGRSGRGWDVCAGGGGKTIALADQLAPDGSVLASDVAAGRLKELDKRLPERLRPQVTPLLLHKDWLTLPTLPTEIRGHAPELTWALIDAPCSGTGSWRRTPFERWRLTPDRVQELIGLQAQLLDRVAAVLAPGAVLLYVTCSVLPEENQHQAEAFLTRDRRFELIDLASVWSAAVQKDLQAGLVGGALQLRPDVQATDGFFMAAFRCKVE